MKKMSVPIICCMLFFTACKSTIHSDVTEKTAITEAKDHTETSQKIKIVKIEDNIYQILLDFVNIYVIDSKKDGFIVIDTGFPEKVDGENILLESLRELGKKPEEVQHILITHAHPDHLGNAGILQEISGADIWMSAIDAPILEDKNTSYRTVYHKDGSVYTGMPTFQKASVQHKTKDGDIIPLAGGIEVIATPGHSLGHQSLLLKKHGGILFAGDAVTNVNGKMDLPPNFENVATEIESVHKLMSYKFDKIAFFHGEYIPENANEKFSERWKNVTYNDVKDDFGNPKK